MALMCTFMVAFSNTSLAEENAKRFAEDYFLGNITTGPEAIYDNSQSQAMAISDLDDTKFVICYSDGGSNGAGKCMVGTRTNTSVTFGSGYSFTGNNIYNIKVVNLSSTEFVFAFRNNNGQAKIRRGTVNGNAISFSSAATITTNYVDHFGLTALSSTKFAVAYKNNNNSGRGAMRIGLISGSGLSLGSNQNFNSNQTNHISLDALDASTIAVSYKDSNNKGTSIIATVSGTSVSFSGEYVYNNANTEWITTVALSSNKFVVVYSDLGNGNSGTACVGTVSGTTISFANEYVFNNGTTSNLVATGHGANNFSMSYSDGANGNNLNANAGTVSGSSITYDSEVTLNGNVQVPATSAVGLNFFVTIYKDDPNGGRSTAIAAQIGGILPVELVDFKARKADLGIQLDWVTASEENNEGFEIQRSADGINWNELDFVRGMGSSFTSNNYSYIDENPLSGVNYYRLKQVDYDGGFSYSAVNSVQWITKGKYELYPNPADTQVWIKSDKNTLPAISIFDSRGSLLKKYASGTDFIDLSYMEKGVYYIQISDGSTVEQHCLIRQ